MKDFKSLINSAYRLARKDGKLLAEFTCVIIDKTKHSEIERTVAYTINHLEEMYSDEWYLETLGYKNTDVEICINGLRQVRVTIDYCAIEVK